MQEIILWQQLYWGSHPSLDTSFWGYSIWQNSWGVADSATARPSPSVKQARKLQWNDLHNREVISIFKWPLLDHGKCRYDQRNVRDLNKSLYYNAWINGPRSDVSIWGLLFMKRLSEKKAIWVTSRRTSLSSIWTLDSWLWKDGFWNDAKCFFWELGKKNKGLLRFPVSDDITWSK